MSHVKIDMSLIPERVEVRHRVIYSFLRFDQRTLCLESLVYGPAQRRSGLIWYGARKAMRAAQKGSSALLND